MTTIIIVLMFATLSLMYEHVPLLVNRGKRRNITDLRTKRTNSDWKKNMAYKGRFSLFMV